MRGMAAEKPQSVDPFLIGDGVRNEPDAMRESLNAALQRNKTYQDDARNAERTALRTAWAELIRQESSRYADPSPVSDDEHCKAIRRISDAVSQRFGVHLVGGRLRFGTSQKALNLYLKYMWRMGRSATPPHCPVDRIVLEAANVSGSWTKNDSEGEYMRWIDRLRLLAKPLTLSEWEYEIWLRAARMQRSAAIKSRGANA